MLSIGHLKPETMSIGMLEDWNIGIMQHKSDFVEALRLFQHSIIPPFYHSKFCLVPVTRHSPLDTLLFAQSVEEVHGLNRIAGFAERAEPAFVDRHKATRAIEPGQCPVHGEPKR